MCIALCYTPPIHHITLYFDKHRTLALGTGLCGAGAGGLAFAPLTTYLLDTYSLRGTFLIMAGIQLNLLIPALLFRPVSFYKHRLMTGNQTGDPAANGSETQTDMCKMVIRLLKNPILLCLCLTFLFMFGAWGTTTSFLLPAWAQEGGLSPRQIGVVVGLFAGSDALGRIAIGWLDSLQMTSSARLLIILELLCALLALLLPIEGRGYLTLCAVVVPYGAVFGGFATVHIGMVYHVTSSQDAPVALGLIALFGIPQIFVQQATGTDF